MRTHDFKLRCDKPKDDDMELQVAHSDLVQDAKPDISARSYRKTPDDKKTGSFFSYEVFIKTGGTDGKDVLARFAEELERYKDRYGLRSVQVPYGDTGEYDEDTASTGMFLSFRHLQTETDAYEAAKSIADKAAKILSQEFKTDIAIDEIDYLSEKGVDDSAEIYDAPAYKNYEYDLGLRVEVDKESFDKLAAQYETDKEDHTAFGYVNSFNVTVNEHEHEYGIAYHTNLSAKSENRMIKADSDPVVIASASKVFLEFENAEFPAVAEEKIKHLYDDVIDELNYKNVKYEIRYIRDFKKQYVSGEEDKPLNQIDSADICDAEPEDLAEEAIEYLAESPNNTVEFDGGRVWFENDGDRWVKFESDEITTEPTTLKTREELKAALVKAINAETEGGDDWEWCEWCHDLFTTSEMVHEKNLGWLCNRCAAAIRSRGEKLIVEDGKANRPKYETPGQYVALGYKKVPVTFNLAEAFDNKTFESLLGRVRLRFHTNIEDITDDELEFAERVKKQLNKGHDTGKNSAWYKQQAEEAERRGYRPLDRLIDYINTKFSSKVKSVAFDLDTDEPVDVEFTVDAYAKYLPDGTLDVQPAFGHFTDLEKEKQVMALGKELSTGKTYAGTGSLISAIVDELGANYQDRFKKEAEVVLGPKPEPVKKEAAKYERPEDFAKKYGEGDPSKENLMLRYFKNERLTPEEEAKVKRIIETKNEKEVKLQGLVKKAEEHFENVILPDMIVRLDLGKVPGWRDFPEYEGFKQYRIYKILKDERGAEKYKAEADAFLKRVKQEKDRLAAKEEADIDFLSSL